MVIRFERNPSSFKGTWKFKNRTNYLHGFHLPPKEPVRVWSPIPLPFGLYLPSKSAIRLRCIAIPFNTAYCRCFQYVGASIDIAVPDQQTFSPHTSTKIWVHTAQDGYFEVFIIIDHICLVKIDQ